MNFFEAVESCFRKYASGEGRAPRSEFWYWTLFTSLLAVLGSVIDFLIFGDLDREIVGPILTLALLLPDVAVSVRRLHDLDRTGWWLLIYLTGIGAIVLLIWFCLAGTRGPNRYGHDPLLRAGDNTTAN